MAIKRISDLPEGSGSLTNDDILLFMDDPSGSGVTKKISLSQISDAIGGGGGGGNADTGDISFSGIQIIGSGTIELVPSSGLYNNDQYLIIDPTAPNHIHLRAGGEEDDSNSQLMIGGDNSNFSVYAGPNPDVSITAQNNTWTFTSSNQTYYVMGNADGNTVTSLDGLNWNGPFDLNTGINHIATNGEYIVVIGSPGGPATTIGYTSFSSPSSVNTINPTVSGLTNIVLNQIIYGGGYFVVVGEGNDGTKSVPVYGYSADGYTWTFKTITGALVNILANNNNENCAFSDVDYNGTGWNFAVLANNVGGGVYTTDITATLIGDNYFSMVSGIQVAWNGNAWYYINSNSGSGFNTSTDPRQGTWDGPFNPWSSSQTDLGIVIEGSMSDTFCGGNGYLAFSDSDGHVSFSNDNGATWTYVTPIPYYATITNIAYINNKFQLTLTGSHTSHDNGEKIIIFGSSVSEYNGTYYLDDENFLYTDYQLTIPWVPEINSFTGTANLTWSHGEYIDAMDYVNGYFYIGNDDEQIARSSNLTTWTIVDDRNNAFEYWNDFSGYSTQYGNVAQFITPNGGTLGAFGMGWPGFYNSNVNVPVTVAARDISSGAPYASMTVYESGENSGELNISVASSGLDNYHEWYFRNNGDTELPPGRALNFGQNIDTLGPPVAGGATDRIRLWDFEGGGSNFNYAIGAEGNHVWFAMDVNNGTGGFKFYSRDNEIFKISDDSKLIFPNGTTIASGTYDNGTSGNGGISLNCVVGYELNWQGGRLKSTYNNGQNTADIFVDSPLSSTPVVLASSSTSNTINTDAKTGDIFDITLNENTTLANPTNPVNGKTIRWRITQDSAGNRSVTLGNKFNIPSSASSLLPWSTSPNKMDVLAATYHSGRDKWDIIAFVPGY